MQDARYDPFIAVMTTRHRRYYCLCSNKIPGTYTFSIVLVDKSRVVRITAINEEKPARSWLFPEDRENVSNTIVAAAAAATATWLRWQQQRQQRLYVFAIIAITAARFGFFADDEQEVI